MLLAEGRGHVQGSCMLLVEGRGHAQASCILLAEEQGAVEQQRTLCLPLVQHNKERQRAPQLQARAGARAVHRAEWLAEQGQHCSQALCAGVCL